MSTTLELNPVTGRILSSAILLLQRHQAFPDEETARQVLLDNIREEEIKMHKLLVHFCFMPANERKELWCRIFTGALNASIPDRKIQKKVLKLFLHDLDDYLVDCTAPAPTGRVASSP